MKECGGPPEWKQSHSPCSSHVKIALDYHILHFMLLSQPAAEIRSSFWQADLTREQLDSQHTVWLPGMCFLCRAHSRFVPNTEQWNLGSVKANCNMEDRAYMGVFFLIMFWYRTQDLTIMKCFFFFFVMWNIKVSPFEMLFSGQSDVQILFRCRLGAKELLYV